MKVILLKDVPKLGRKHDVKEVSDGHALNFLVPRGLVEVATGGALKKVEALKKTEDFLKKHYINKMISKREMGYISKRNRPKKTMAIIHHG